MYLAGSRVVSEKVNDVSLHFGWLNFYLLTYAMVWLKSSLGGSILF